MATNDGGREVGGSDKVIDEDRITMKPNTCRKHGACNANSPAMSDYRYY